MNPKPNCKKLRYGKREDPTVILGLILSEDSDFLVFRTANKKYHINRKEILSIEDTNVEFKEDYGGDNDY
jgi:hypothetical protein